MSCHKKTLKQLNVAIPEQILRYVTGQAKLSGMSIKSFVQEALIEYGRKMEHERGNLLSEVKQEEDND